jgi:hypothetical protein
VLFAQLDIDSEREERLCKRLLMSFWMLQLILFLFFPLLGLLVFHKLSIFNLLLSVASSLFCGWIAGFIVGVLDYGGTFSKPGIQIGQVYYGWDVFGMIGGAVFGTVISLIAIHYRDVKKNRK